MPLILISGYPASGKSTRAEGLKQYFTEQGKLVKIITENTAVPKAGFQKNEFFADSQKEKLVRSDLKSEVIRHLNNENVIIFDAGNYIKGYRYELFCATKSARTTQCTLFVGIEKEKAWELNLKRTGTYTNLQADVDVLNDSSVSYSREIFDELCMRFEEPHGNCRWDSPLFVVFPEDILDFKGVENALFSRKPPPPNQSTQNPPLSATNYLFELDKITQEIFRTVADARKIGILGPVSVNGTDIKVDVPNTINVMQLNKIRRQFLNYSKTHSSSTTIEKAPQLFVQFLNSFFNK